jgi:hypothetical protein
MLNSVLQNREGLNFIAQKDTKFPLFSQNDWAVIDALTNILASLHGATLQIENRNTSISSYIPITQTIISNFNKNVNTGVLDFRRFKNTIATGLENRLKNWDDKRY